MITDPHKGVDHATPLWPRSWALGLDMATPSDSTLTAAAVRYSSSTTH